MYIYKSRRIRRFHYLRYWSGEKENIKWKILWRNKTYMEYYEALYLSLSMMAITDLIPNGNMNTNASDRRSAWARKPALQTTWAWMMQSGIISTGMNWKRSSYRPSRTNAGRYRRVESGGCQAWWTYRCQQGGYECCGGVEGKRGCCAGQFYYIKK